MNQNRKYVLNNMLSQIIVQFVTLVAGIFIPRYIILYYGSEINGVSSTVNQLITYASLLEAGLGTASIQALYKPLAREDVSTISAVCSSARIFYNKVGKYFSVIIFLSAVIYPFIARGETDKLTIGLLVIVISFTNIFEYFFHAKYRVLLTADQKLYVISYTRAIGLILQTIVKFFLILLRVNVIYVFLVSSLTLILRIFFVKRYVKKHYPYLNFHTEPDVSALKQRGALIWHQFCGLIVNNTGVIIISVALPSGLVLASIYSVYSMVISNLYNLITGTLSNGVVATFGQMMIKEDNAAFVKNYRNYEFLYYFVVSVVFGTVSVMLLPFVSLYTKGSDIVYVDSSIAILFTIVGILNCSRVPSGMLINAAGHFIQTKVRAIIEAGINLICTLLLVWHFQILGVLMASVASFAYRVPDILFYSNKNIIHDKPWNSFSRMFRMWSVILIGTVLMNRVVFADFECLSFGMWIIMSIITVCIFAVLAFAVNMIFESKSMLEMLHLINKNGNK